MRTMRERAEELRGSFDASSQDLGTVVVARLPLTGVASAAVTAPAADLLP
jgi:signal transduction histidine kinase